MPWNLQCRDETRPKFEAIARIRRWTLIETADALADAYLESHPDCRPSVEGEPGDSIAGHEVGSEQDNASKG